MTKEEWSERCSIAGFEDGRNGPWDKECRQPLATDEDKEMETPLELPEGNKVLDFSLVRHMSIFWPTEIYSYR